MPQNNHAIGEGSVATSTVSKPQGRDSALTWEIPTEISQSDLHFDISSSRKTSLDISRRHVEDLCSQLLSADNINNVEAWAPLLTALSYDASSLLSPGSLRASGNINPWSFIKVESIPLPASKTDPSAPSSTNNPQLGGMLIDGVVCHKNVAHKRMRTYIETPRIVALRGALEYERSSDKLSSFDSLMNGEQQHLKASVQSIVSAKPDVVLVEGSVSQAAQELLLEAGISVVANLPTEAFHRISVCTGTTILPLSSQGPSEESMGTCRVFEVKTITYETIAQHQQNKLLDVADHNDTNDTSPAAIFHPPPPPVPATTSLMMFNGCNQGLGATIVLEGNDTHEIEKIKHITSSIAYCAYWNRLEASFLADQYAAAIACTVGVDDSQISRAVEASSEKVVERRDAQTKSGIASPSPHVSSSLPTSSVTQNIQDADGGKKSDDASMSRKNDSFHARQQLWSSISCRNPTKGILCENPHPHSMPYYQSGDLSLIDFLAAAAPINRKCPHPQCGDGAALHLRSFMHGNSLITLSSVHLPEKDELPGKDKRWVWMWLRPLGISTSPTPPVSSHRVLLSTDSACISFAHLLSLLLDARDLAVQGTDMQHGFVRYIGCGNTVICLHHTSIKLYTVQFPPTLLSVVEETRQQWLEDEMRMLVEEADEVFTCIKENVDAISVHLDLDSVEKASVLLESIRSGYMELAGGIRMHAGSVWAINKIKHYLAVIAQQWDKALLNIKPIAAVDAMAHTNGSAQQDHSSHHHHVSGGQDLVPGTSVGISSSEGHVQQQQQHHHHGGGIDDTSTGSMAASQSAVRPKMQTGAFGFLAPKLVDVEVSERTTTDSSTHSEVIPTGLVARYVAMFDDSNTMAVGDTAGAPLIKRDHGPATTIDLKNPTFLRLFSKFGRMEDNDFEDQVKGMTEELDMLSASVVKIEEQMTTMVQRAAQQLLSGRAVMSGVDVHPLVTIYDKEPTSIVAYFLSTQEYKQYLDGAKQDCLATVSHTGSSLDDDEQVLLTSLQLDCQMLVEDTPPLPTAPRARFQMKAYYAPHFAALRNICIDDGEDAFLSSLARCKPWSAQGGKSNVFFAKTRDDRYVLKQLSRSEKQSFLEFAPEYFKYMRNALDKGKSTCLCKILGVYQVSLEYSNGKAPFGNKDGVLDFIIMENLFHGCSVNAIYDLKGSERDRYVAETSKNVDSAPVVLLDENLRELNQASPTLLAPGTFARLQQMLYADTEFLACLDVMDYSLLVGFHKARQELVVGLVDYVRTYTWDKQVESWVKKSGLLGGAGKEPTIIGPRQYAKRFRAAMMSYFTQVPSLSMPPVEIDEF